MATTLADLRTAVGQIFKRTDKSTEIDAFINDTLREMTAVVDPRKLKDQEYVPTVLGQEDYALPSTILRLNHPIRLIDTLANNNSSSSHPLNFITKENYDELQPNPNATTVTTGEPRDYTIYKNCILLNPIPDRATYRLEINMGGNPTDLAGPTDAIIFNDVWKETIKAGSLARLYSMMELFAESQYWMAIYTSGMSGRGGMSFLKSMEDATIYAPTIVNNNSL